MKKRNLVTLLLTGTMLLALTACGNKNNTETPADTPASTTVTEQPDATTTAPEETPVPEADPTEVPAPAGKTVAPLPITVDMNNLTDCTVAVSFEKEDVSVDATGAKQLNVTVYTYDLYDMIDIALLEVGDTILLRGEEVVVTDLVRTDAGSVQINGGLDAGGYELITNEDTVYFETGYSDVKTYFALGEAVLPVSDNFTFADSADPESSSATFSFEDLLSDKVAYIFRFTPHNTRIVIEGGVITQMERVYTP